jgi:hypothetical protein
MPKPERWIDALGHSFIENLVVDIHRSMRGVVFSSSPSAKDPADSSTQHCISALGASHKSISDCQEDIGCECDWARTVSDRLVLHTLNYSNSTIQATNSPVRRLNCSSLSILIFQQSKSAVVRTTIIAQR